MLNITASICGTISGNAVVTTDEKGKSSLEFTMKVEIPSRSDEKCKVDIHVIVDDGNHEHIKDYCNGNRIVMDGKLSVKKADDSLIFILRNAVPQINYCVSSDDYVKGDVTFTGKVHKVSERTDKRGRKFVVMSASSPVSLGYNNWDYIWVTFLRFVSKTITEDELTPDWLTPGVNVEILGDCQITSYNGRVGISSRVMEMCLKEKPAVGTEEDASTAI